MVFLQGIEHLDKAGARVVILAPHFAGIEAAGIRLSIDRDLSTLYQHQKDPVVDRQLIEGRTRFRSNISRSARERSSPRETGFCGSNRAKPTLRESL